MQRDGTARDATVHEDGLPPASSADPTTVSLQACESERASDRPLSLDSPPPQRIDRYVVQRLLGRGSFGAVYLAHDERLDRLVAIKTPRPGRFSGDSAVEAFRKRSWDSIGNILAVCQPGMTLKVTLTTKQFRGRCP